MKVARLLATASTSERPQRPDFLHSHFVSHSVLGDRCSALSVERWTLSVERLHYPVSTTLTSILSLRERKPQQCLDSVESSDGPCPLFVSRGAKAAPTLTVCPQ
jgi:hypothetical protein